MFKQRSLGRTGMSTPPLMLGGNVFGWTADRTASYSVLDAYLDGGGKLIDTADMYSNWIPGLRGGESENMIGEWQSQRRCRDRILIATKVGRGSGDVAGLSRQAIMKGIDESLRRLRTDYVDVYFAHLDDDSVPMEETLGAFDELVRSGKVRALGASHFSVERLMQAHAISSAQGWARYEVLQPRYNLMERASFEGSLQDYCVANEVGVVPFYALASGFLTGKYRNESDLLGRQRGAEVRKYLAPAGMRVLQALDAVALARGTTAAQVALAWLMAQPGVTAPIASATSAVQVVELLTAMSLELSSDELGSVTAASAPLLHPQE